MEVQQIMTTVVSTISPEDTVGDLHSIFSQVTYHHLPVISEGRLVGIISDRDVLRSLSPFVGTAEQRPEDEALLMKKVSEIMTPSPVTVDPTTFVDCASILLLENRISCLPVVDEDDHLQGILTWKDILRFHVYYDALTESA